LRYLRQASRRSSVRLTDPNFDEEVLLSEIPVLVDFWASWCIPSQMMKPVIDDLTREYEGRVKIGKINVDQNPKTRDRYKIDGCPTVIVFKGGKEVLRRVGAQSDGQLRNLMENVLGDSEKELK
jgi:thioredoxin 1